MIRANLLLSSVRSNVLLSQTGAEEVLEAIAGDGGRLFVMHDSLVIFEERISTDIRSSICPARQPDYFSSVKVSGSRLTSNL